jgi:fibronectin type 3 domain-containing protein
VRRSGVLLLLLLGVATPALGQDLARPLLLVPKGDSVLVYLLEQPPVLGGFVVYRGLVGQPSQRLTATPVLRVREPALAAGMIGTDLPAVMRAARATDAADMLRRLRSDPFAGALTSLLFRSVATVAGRLYVDGGVTPGAEYEYRVVLTDGAGRETDRQFSGRVVVRDAAPAAPGAGRIGAGDGEIAFGWTYPRFRGDPRDFVVGFHIYRADGTGTRLRLTGTPIVRNDASPLQYRDRDVASRTAYRYDVTAVDVLGQESAPSPVMSVVPADHTAPAVPTGLAVDPGDGIVRLVWRMSPETDVAGYHVERSTGLTAPYARLSRSLVAAGDPEWTDSTVTGGRGYFYRVIAVDSAGNASAPSNALSALPTDRTPPAPPAGVTAALQGRRVLVRWTASPSRGVQGYYVYRGDTEARLVRLMTRPLPAVQFVDSGYANTGLRPGGHYLVRVSAVDSSGNESAQAGTQVVLPDDEPPSAPSSFEARNTLGRYVALSWSSSSSPDVEWYVLTRATGDSAAVEIGRFGPRGLESRDTAVVRGRRYVYALVAVDSAGNRSPAVRDTVAFRDITPPAAPRFVTARVAPAGVQVSWERSGSADLAGYHVYRMPLPTGVLEKLTTAPVAVLTFTDRTGRAGLYYVIRAVDRSGNESEPSAPVQAIVP